MSSEEQNQHFAEFERSRMATAAHNGNRHEYRHPHKRGWSTVIELPSTDMTRPTSIGRCWPKRGEGILIGLASDAIFADDGASQPGEQTSWSSDYSFSATIANSESRPATLVPFCTSLLVDKKRTLCYSRDTYPALCVGSFFVPCFGGIRICNLLRGEFGSNLFHLKEARPVA